MTRPSLLLIEDKENPREMVTLYAQPYGYSIKYASTVQEALSHIRSAPPFEVIIVDLQLGVEDEDFQEGWKFLRQTHQDSNTYTVIFTGHEDPQRLMIPYPAVEGRSFTLLRKGRDEERLSTILRDQAALHRFRTSGKAITASKQDKELRANLPLIAASGLPVLITGGSGMGKEWVAQELACLALPVSQHHRIHTVNCATLTETFGLALLFGYVKGAYTGANPEGDLGILRRISGQPHKGRTAPADGTELPGVLILDELAELPPFVQAQLLRALQGQRIYPLGDSATGYVPLIRVIACTNDESKLSDPDKFRQDLLGRLDGWHVKVGDPPERKETFVEAARVEATGFSMTLQYGQTPIRITDVADDVAAEVEGKLVELRQFGFRGLKAWIGRACSLALWQEKKDTRLTAEHLREAWDSHRMRLTDTAKAPSEDLFTEEIRHEAEKLRKDFIALFARANITLSENWTGKEFKRCYNNVQKRDEKTAQAIAAKKEDYSTSDQRAKLIVIFAFRQHDKLSQGEVNEQVTKALANIRSYFRTSEGTSS